MACSRWSSSPTASLPVGLPPVAFSICRFRAPIWLVRLLISGAMFFDVGVDVAAEQLGLAGHLVDRGRQRLALQDGEIEHRGVAGLVEDVVDAGEEGIHRGAEIAAVQRPDDAFQLRVGALHAVGVGLIGGRAPQLGFQEVVDLLRDRLHLDAGAQQQVAVLLRRRGSDLHLLVDVARRVGVGNVLAHDLQANVVGQQGIAGHLDGTEQRHRFSYLRSVCHGCVSRVALPSARFARLGQPWHCISPS